MATPQKVHCIIKNIVTHCRGVYTIELIPDHAVPFFRPGQFLQLAIDPYDPSKFWPESRAFSIASTPEDRMRLSLTYSVRGQFTSRMEKELKEGRDVWVKLPYGEFIVPEKKSVVLIAGGTGITAFSAFLSQISEKDSQPITMIYGSRSAELLIYRPLIDQCKMRKKDLQVIYFIESAYDEKSGILRGVISIEKVWAEISNFSSRVFFLSGPPIMLKSLTTQLIQLGVEPTDIHIDAWE